MRIPFDLHRFDMNPIDEIRNWTPYDATPPKKGPGDSFGRKLTPSERAGRKAKNRAARSSRRRNRA